MKNILEIENLPQLREHVAQQFQRTITIPALEQHEGIFSVTATVPWICLHCGGPRGEPIDTLSYDGSRRLGVSGWTNPCGHVEKYSEVRAAIAKATGQS